MSLPRLLVIDDNPDFGGHQVMAAYAIEGIAASGEWDLLTLLHPANSKNQERLQAIRAKHPKVDFSIGVAATRSRKFQALRRYGEGAALRELATQIQAFQPDLILLIQGNIEQGCSIFRLKSRLPCPMLSYIPVPHRHAEMGAKLGALRDLSCRGLYAVPDGFITISKTLGDMLLRYGAKGRIQIVENGIPLEPFKTQTGKDAARDHFGLPPEGFFWGQIGRVEFKQKGQDCSLDLFLERAKRHLGEHLVFLGSGPDEEELLARAGDHPQVHCLPWTDQPAPLYAALDALIMPSRYEGVPLAMLEALANGLPVVATDRDGMCDWLPEAWRFPYRDIPGGLRAMEAVCNAEPGRVYDLKKRVWDRHSVADFQMGFIAALRQWL